MSLNQPPIHRLESIVHAIKDMTGVRSVLNLPLFSYSSGSFSSFPSPKSPSLPRSIFSPPLNSTDPLPRPSLRNLGATKSTAMEPAAADQTTGAGEPMKLLFVEMGVGYDQHGQDVTVAAMRACRDAITSNSIPAFRRGSIPGVSFEQMKLQIKLGVPHALQQDLDIERVKSVFPYGKIMNVEVVDGGLVSSSGVVVEEMGDKNDDCYIVNAAVYVGY